jgi:hypothetical protein
MTYLAALQGHPDAARTILQKGPQGNRNVCPSELPPVTQYQSVTVLFVPRDKAQAILPMLVRKSVVPRMGYSAYPAGGFDSLEISARAGLFAPMGNFADSRACMIIC